MNLFKPFYTKVNAILKNFRSVEARRNDAESSEELFPSKTYRKKKLAITYEEQERWQELIRRYIEKFTSREERRFLYLLYSKNETMTYVCRECFLGLRTAQDWREEHLKNIIALAMQEGLLKIDLS